MKSLEHEFSKYFLTNLKSQFDFTSIKKVTWITHVQGGNILQLEDCYSIIKLLRTSLKISYRYHSLDKFIRRIKGAI